jgi:hypothetical protein
MRILWERWKRFGKRAGDIQARALLTFFYFVLLSPFALAVRPMAIKPDSAKGWRAREDSDATVAEQATRQF